MRIPAFALSLFASLLGGCGGAPTPLPCALPPMRGTPRPDLPTPAVSPCDANGWCWENPLPFLDTIGPLHHGADVTVVTSDRGHVLRLVAGVWEALPPLPKPPSYTGDVSPTAVAALDELVYVAASVGLDGAFYRFDGAAWELFQTTTRFVAGSIALTARDRLMLVGRGGAMRFDGRALVPVATPRMTGQGVWGCRSDYFGAFFQGSFTDEELVLARAGASFEKLGALPNVNVQVTDVSGSGPTDVFFAGFPNGGSAAAVWHWDGANVVDVSIADAYAVLDLVALGDGDAIATGSRQGGGSATWRRRSGTWEPLASQGFGQIAAAAADDMLATNGADLFQFDGTTFRSPFPLPLPSAPGSTSFVGVYGDATAEPLVIATNAVYRRTASGFVAATVPALGTRSLRGACGSPQDVDFVFGSAGLLLAFDGTGFTEHTIPASEFAGDVSACSVVAGGDTFVGTTSGKIYRFDGTTFAEVARLIDVIVGVHAVSNSQVWAVDARGRLSHFDGVLWDGSASIEAGFPDVVALAGNGSAIFALGPRRAYQLVGTSFVATDLPLPGTMSALHVKSATDVDLVGTSGTAYHFDGTNYVDASADLAWALRGVSGYPGGTIVVGDLGTIVTRPNAMP